MITFTFESLEEAYPQLLKYLLDEGTDVSPRGMLTKEISPIGITILNPRKRVIPHKTRNLNYGFMVGELLWMLQGTNNLEHVTHYNKQWNNYSDDGKTLNGAYGQRIFNWDGLYDIYEEHIVDENGNTHPKFNCEHIVMDQFQLAYEQLKADKDSRQATIVLFNPVQDYRETKDKPCTNLIRFMIRDDKLNMTVFMRSNDIWFGAAYDIFNFTMMQEIMAGKLGVEVGKYTHIADSLHIYETHFELAKKLINESNVTKLYNDELMDARVSEENLYNELKKVFDVEASTRLTADVLKVEKVEKMLNDINNEYWQSLAAVVALYNFRKAKRTQRELDVIRKYVVNEFKEVINKYNELK